MAPARATVITPGTDRAAILNLVRQYPNGVSTRELSTKTKLPVNRISGIASKLTAYGFLTVVRKQVHPLGGTAKWENIWGAK